MTYHRVLIVLLCVHYSSAMNTELEEKIVIEEENLKKETNLEKKPSLKNTDSHKSPKLFSGKKETIYFSRSSNNSMDNQKNNYIAFEVPQEISNVLKMSHQLDLLAHNDLNSKIEGIEYRTKQLCEKNFDLNDKFVAITKEQQRNNRCNRLLLCGCTTLAAVYIVLSIAGVVLGIHFIPIK